MNRRDFIRSTVLAIAGAVAITQFGAEPEPEEVKQLRAGSRIEWVTDPNCPDDQVYYVTRVEASTITISTTPDGQPIGFRSAGGA